MRIPEGHQAKYAKLLEIIPREFELRDDLFVVYINGVK